jgi:hypothetical protein
LSFKNNPDNQQMVLGKRDKTFDDLLISFHPERSAYSHLGYNGQGDFVSKQLYTAQLNVIRVAPNKTEVLGVVVAGGADSTAETNALFKSSTATRPLYDLTVWRSASMRQTEPCRIFRLKNWKSSKCVNLTKLNILFWQLVGVI